MAVAFGNAEARPSAGVPEGLARLDMRGIGKSFGATVALRDVTFALATGEVHALVGENGAGKSTLMKVLSGAHQPDAGAMWLDGASYRPRNPLEARRAGVGMFYQESSIVPHLTVEENLFLGCEPLRHGILQRPRMRRKALEALALLGHDEIRPERSAGGLSVGAQQVVEIARALALGCRVLVFDEPTSSIGKRDIERLFKIIGKLKADGISIVYISHFLEEVKEIADRVTVLRDGSAVGTAQVSDLTAPEIVALMVGREVSELYPKSGRIRGEPVLVVSGLAGKARPREATLTLHRGEVLGIFGLVGAGRTELLRAIHGLDPVRRGKVRVGVFEGGASPAVRWRQGVGIVSENRKEEGLAAGMSVADNMTLSSLGGLGPAGLISPARQRRRVAEWVSALGIRCGDPSHPIESLSGGNQQKVALARLLHHDVDVLLLDEPTRGIDVGAKARIYETIDRLASTPDAEGRAKAILMVSSYLPELLGMCDRIAVMANGRLGPARPVDEVDPGELMLEATGKGDCQS